MPIHFEDQDVAPEVAGLRSALIVPCNLCPAVTVATRENRPFMRFFRSPLKSAPFEEYLERLQSRLREKGVSTEVFRSNLYHQWFMCMWTSRRRKKLEKQAENYDAVIVLGCDSATETVRGRGASRREGHRRHEDRRYHERKNEPPVAGRSLL